MHAAQGLLADTWMHGGWGWGWMTLMMVVMVLFWGAVIFGIFWLIRGAARGEWGRSARPADEQNPADKESPVDILDRRFAEGAITPEDYQARREVLLNVPARSNGDQREELLTAPGAEGRQR